MKDIYETFEFNEIIKMIEPYAKTEIGLRMIRKLKMFSDVSLLNDELSHLEEIISYTQKYRNLKIYPHKDISTYISLIKKGGRGNIEFFYQVHEYLENAKELIDETLKDENYPYLNSLISSLNDLENLKYRIEKVINKDLTISDSASSTLREIRKQLKNEIASQSKIMNSLMIKYKDYLNDEHVALRNANYTLSIKQTYKNKVDGVVVDESTSGNTAFIEPLEIIVSNNKIQRLKEKEKEEIDRILDELTASSYNNIDDIKVDQDVITYLDFLLAKGNFALDNNYLVPKIVSDKKISFIGARHPLIDVNKVVKNDFVLDKEKIMIITGPNAGGKTVALKVIGLLVIMAESGLALPTSKRGELSFFNSVYVDMGDSQSLIDNLSTFSGHVKNLKEIVSLIDDSSLVIFDELGSGTSPLDGEALAISSIKYIHEKNAFGIITSHFDGVKTFALENDYILNASMAFDEENITPTYRLRLGVAGKSYGLEMAYRLGLNRTILEDASNYLEEKRKSDKEITLKMLQKKLEENEQIQFELKEKEDLLNKKINSLEAQKKELQKQIDLVKENAEEEKEKLVQEAKEKIEKAYEDFVSNEDKKLHQVIKAKKDLDDLLDDEDVNSEATFIPNIGDYVRATNYGVIGKVIRIKGENITLITNGGMNITAKVNELTKVSKAQEPKKKVYTPSYKLDKKVPLECNIVGYHIEEGIREIDKYLDDAITAHYSEVRLIHGSGTGKLRSAVHEYLNKRKDIKSYRLGGLGEGGVGATVVTLK